MSSFCICKSSDFFSNNTCELDSLLTRTVDILTVNEPIFPDCCFDNYSISKINQNKCSDTVSFTKIIYALTEVLKNSHTHCERNRHAYHKNT